MIFAAVDLGVKSIRHPISDSIMEPDETATAFMDSPSDDFWLKLRS